MHERRQINRHSRWRASIFSSDRRRVAKNATLEDLLSEGADFRRAVIPVPRQRRFASEIRPEELRKEPLLDNEARKARIIRGEALRWIQRNLQRPAAFHSAVAVLPFIRERTMPWTMLTARRRVIVGRAFGNSLRNCAVIRRHQPRKNHHQRAQEPRSSSLAQSQREPHVTYRGATSSKAKKIRHFPWREFFSELILRILFYSKNFDLRPSY
jgi:hypothetical protein